MPIPSEDSHSLLFDSSKVTVLFVLGGRGAGKRFLSKLSSPRSRLSTLKARLLRVALPPFLFLPLTFPPASDLLRTEQVREGSEYGQLIRICIREGTIVPSHVTITAITLIQNAMTAVLVERSGSGNGWNDGRGRFPIDGFPRTMEQAKSSDDTVWCLPLSPSIVFNC
ncbi:hypothetical protein Agabi119p4_5851 [Agaricus bisporus var. burnettii]|uniref:Uncharacterized protein n=1 Tax=Agaricus bisporus var. burnettii TaxID=192524 RepID=A0A8H7KGY0_AGABI|nr:hypothetical protein Agabi119p4_5851 [Agaricus bisporus var. burnettii]